MVVIAEVLGKKESWEPAPGPMSRTTPVERARTGGIRAEEPVRVSACCSGSVVGSVSRAADRVGLLLSMYIFLWWCF